jgi:hypothetical protein
VTLPGECADALDAQLLQFRHRGERRAFEQRGQTDVGLFKFGQAPNQPANIIGFNRRRWIRGKRPSVRYLLNQDSRSRIARGQKFAARCKAAVRKLGESRKEDGQHRVVLG